MGNLLTLTAKFEHAALEPVLYLALRFFGAAEANTRDTGIVRDPADDAFLQPLIQAARASHDQEAAARAESDGAKAGYEAVLGEVDVWLEQEG